MAQFDLTPAQRDTLIRTALGEARGQGQEGMADVLQVIINRANSGRYPSDPAAVALQPSQFSTWDSTQNGGNNPRQFSPNSRIYKTAAQALDAVVAGRPDPTGGALFYHAPSVNPGWANSANTNGTIRRNGHIFYPTHPVPPGEIPSVATFLDAVRMPPKPAAPSASVAFRRQNTSPLGDNTSLPAALQQYATRKANQVTPAIRRTPLPAMGTPNVNSLYAGIYPQQNLTSPGAVEASVRSTAQDPTLAAALARRVAPPSIPQSQIDRGQPRIGQSIIDRVLARIPPSQGNLTDPGAINASVGGLTQNAALQAALARSIASPQPAPQSMVERGTPRIGQSTIERGVNRLPPVPATQSVDLRQSRAPLPSPIGQPPATRVVQSVSVPGSVPQRMAAQDVGNVARSMPIASRAVPQSYAGQETGAPRAYTPTPLNGLDRLPASVGLPEAYGNAAIGGADIMRFGVPAAQIAPVPAVRPASFTTQMQPTQVLNPAWSATPAAIPAGTPMSGGLSRDAVALRAKGLAQAQAMANVPKYITVNRPVQVPMRVPAPVAAPLRIAAPVMQQSPVAAIMPRPGVVSSPLSAVGQLRAQGLSPADAYAAANANAAARAMANSKYGSSSSSGRSSLSTMSGQRSFME